MGRIEKMMAKHWTEHRPVPLQLDDTAILDWMTEYCDQAVYNRPTREYAGGFTLYCDNEKTQGETLREAVCLAAAKFKEANPDYLEQPEGV